MKRRVMFVCTGNICRSPMAHAVFEHKVEQHGLESLFEAESSGTTAFHVGEQADARGRAELRKHGISFRHTSLRFRPEDASRYDLIVAMDRSNYASIMRSVAPEQREKVKMLRSFDSDAGDTAEVPDPYYGGDRGFSEVYAMIDRSIDDMIEYMTKSFGNETKNAG